MVGECENKKERDVWKENMRKKDECDMENFGTTLLIDNNEKTNGILRDRW